MESDNPEMGWRMKMSGVNYFKLMISYYKILHQDLIWIS